MVNWNETIRKLMEEEDEKSLSSTKECEFARKVHENADGTNNFQKYKIETLKCCECGKNIAFYHSRVCDSDSRFRTIFPANKLMCYQCMASICHMADALESRIIPGFQKLILERTDYSYVLAAAWLSKVKAFLEKIGKR